MSKKILDLYIVQINGSNYLNNTEIKKKQEQIGTILT